MPTSSPRCAPVAASCGATSPDQFRALLPRAIEVLSTQLTDRYDRARFDAAKTILRMVNLKEVLAAGDDDDEDAAA
jgi:hypothetical protein